MSLARIAALLADQTRATFCLALLDGRAWTAGELARHAGSLAVDRERTPDPPDRRRSAGRGAPGPAPLRPAGQPDGGGPDRGPGVLLAATPTPRNLRESVQTSAEARARTCYDHLAGTLGVAITDAMTDRGFLTHDQGLAITDAGVASLTDLGIDLTPPAVDPGP